MFRHSAHFCLLLIAVAPLSGCAGSSQALDALQKQIQEEVVKQGGSTLKRVICEAPKAGDEKSIQCIGLLESGSGFDIAAQKQDDQSYKWEILSIKGLLNISQIQRSIQDGLKTEVGEVSLDCGTGAALYKIANPGDTWDCQFKVITPTGDQQFTKQSSKETAKETSKNALEKTKSDQSDKPPIEKDGKVTISMMPSGDINWQRITATKSDTAKSDAKPDEKSNTAKPGAAAPGKITDSKPTNQKSVSEAKGSEALPDSAPPAQNADDALNQPGALDNLED
jgi:hypothetical protein